MDNISLKLNEVCLKYCSFMLQITQSYTAKVFDAIQSGGKNGLFSVYIAETNGLVQNRVEQVYAYSMFLELTVQLP